MPAPAQRVDEPRLTLAGIGTQVTLQVQGTGSPDLHHALTAAWSRCLVAAAGEGAGVVLASYSPGSAVADDDTHVGGTDLAELLPRVTQTVTRALIAAQTGRLLMLHAGAVCHPDTGRTAVFVAPGGTGKTTLTRVLVDRYAYLTDETVAIDDEHRVLAYPKPLSVRRAGGPKQELSPDELSLVAAPTGPTVARLLLLDRDDAHAGPPQVAELPLFDAITELAAQSSALYALPSGLRFLAGLIEATGPVLRVRYAEAVDLTGVVADLIGEAP